MKSKGRLLVVGALLAAVFLLSGCFFNVFQTARTVGKGKAAVGLGGGDDEHGPTTR